MMYPEDFETFEVDDDEPVEDPYLLASPMIRVHDLSESVFCSRAGVISLAKSAEDPDTEPNLGPKLSGFWNFDEHRFNEAINQTLLKSVLMSVLFAATCILGIVGATYSVIWIPVAYFAARWVGPQAWRSGYRLFNLVLERRRLLQARCDDFAVRPTKVQYLSWWVLRRFGFECILPEDLLSDDREKVVGKPWRILQLGDDILVPVVRKHRGRNTRGPQHTVRLMAYCYLIERCTNAKSPFGVLLFNSGDQCVIIPNDGEHRSEFWEALHDFRELLYNGPNAGALLVDPPGSRCSGCEFGRPRKYRAGVTTTILGGEELAPFLDDGFHSDCGDRFCWCPLHTNKLARMEKESENFRSADV